VSWSLLAFPLHEIAANGGWDWALDDGRTHGMPKHPPAPQPLPTAAQVVTAFRDAGCHGTAWYHIDGPGTPDELPACPNIGPCANAGGLDLGEVQLGPRNGDREHLVPTTPIASMGFRKPVSLAVLTAMHRLSSSAGPILIYHDSASDMFVVSPHDALNELAQHWPW
jgi:hypothetical protein